MPIPTGNTVWPPADFAPIAAKYAEHSAWYSGDPGALSSVYTRATAPRVDKTAQYRGGITGAVARMWWGRPVGDLTKRREGLHVPLASDICQTSADLLFSEPPSLKSDDPTTQARLDDLAADGGLLSTMAESAELVAALGGGFQRVTWDKSRDGAFISNVDADGAYPVFRWGQLSEVTFWWDVQSDQNGVVWRHIEHHQMDAQGVGVIVHGLYQGTCDNLGKVKPLQDHPSTAGLATAVDAESSISTQSPGLAVEYFPNQLPQRLLRTHPVGRNLGRSDLSGIEGLMDSIDESYTSWMRDIRLGKARIIVPGYMLKSGGRGEGAFFDLDQDVYEKLNVPPAETGEGIGITAQQFKIRFAEHEATINALVKAALRTAGYSGETFGEDGSAGMKTATEVVSEQNRSYMTRDRKIRLLKPRQLRILRKLLAVDNAMFNAGVDPEKVSMDFADGVQADPEALARTSQSLRVAQAASTETLVALNHPDWDEAAVKEEAGRIIAENSLSVPDLGPDTEPPTTDES